MLVPSLGQEDSPGGGRGNPLQYSCLENPMDGGAWQATVHGVTGSDMTEVTEHTHTFPLAFFFFALKIVYKLLLANRVI